MNYLPSLLPLMPLKGCWADRAPLVLLGFWVRTSPFGEHVSWAGKRLDSSLLSTLGKLSCGYKKQKNKIKDWETVKIDGRVSIQQSSFEWLLSHWQSSEKSFDSDFSKWHQESVLCDCPQEACSSHGWFFPSFFYKTEKEGKLSWRVGTGSPDSAM